MINAPGQFTTADNSLTGAINGNNPAFSLIPAPTTLLYSTSGVTGLLVFRNGLLIDELFDYAAGPGFLSVSFAEVTDNITAMAYLNGSAPTKLRLATCGLTAFGSYSLALSPNGPVDPATRDLMLFLNGLMLTNGADFSITGPWISLVNPIQPGDLFTAVIDMGGLPCSTANGTISGVIDGVNSDFSFPFPTAFQMIFWNGLLMTEGVDYLLTNKGSAILGAGGPALPDEGLPGEVLPGFESVIIPQPGFVLLAPVPPQPGDIISAQVYITADAVVFGLGTFFGGPALPGQGLPGEILPGFEDDAPVVVQRVLEAFSPNAIQPPLQLTNADGTLTYTQPAGALLFRNGLLMTQPADGLVAGHSATFSPWQTPHVSDIVTVEAWAPNILDSTEPALNLPVQFSTNDGSLAGTLDGANNLFVVQTDALITEMFLGWNGLEMTTGLDYSWTCSQPSSAGAWVTTITMQAGQYPSASDVLTAEVFFS